MQLPLFGRSIITSLMEAEFRYGSYYPDLLNEQIFILMEKLRLLLVDPGQSLQSALVELQLPSETSRSQGR
ncbi:MAG TPA: hypothetical protein VE641_14235 [Chthoniobacterales bacterium]|nr:hypothetical protein [Chthoniobacterales bacterium]